MFVYLKLLSHLFFKIQRSQMNFLMRQILQDWCQVTFHLLCSACYTSDWTSRRHWFRSWRWKESIQTTRFEKKNNLVSSFITVISSSICGCGNWILEDSTSNRYLNLIQKFTFFSEVSVVMEFILSPWPLQVLGCLVFTKDWFQDKVCLILNQVLH